MKSFENIEFTVEEGGIAIITLNRPNVMNALCDELNDDIIEALEIVKTDLSLRALIITGKGKAFAAGADISEMSKADTFSSVRLASKANVINFELENLPIPVIAAINGPAFGGGCEMVLACDFRIIGENAVIGLPEVGLGIIPGAGGTQRITKLLGPVKAKEVVMAGAVMKGQEAANVGLATKCVADTEVLNEAMSYARKLCKKPAASLQYSKAAVNFAVGHDLETGIAYERSLFALCFATEDQKEGMSAFAEKRAPNFTNKR